MGSLMRAFVICLLAQFSIMQGAEPSRFTLEREESPSPIVYYFSQPET